MPAAFLKGFFGIRKHPRYLQADAFGGYDELYASPPGEPGNDRVVLEVACWSAP